MARSSRYTLVFVTLLAIGTAYWLNANEPRRVWPKPTPPPPPSPVFEQSTEPVPTEEEIARDAEQHSARVQEAIERSLQAADADAREAAFVFLLPQLLQLEPDRVVAMVARQEGRARQLLRREVARQWVGWDVPAAVRWIRALEGVERRETAQIAVTTLATYDLPTALWMVEELDVDGVELGVPRGRALMQDPGS